MTSRHKELEKSLKAPDPFQVQVMSLMDWGVKNSRYLVYAAAPVVVVTAGFFLFQYLQTQRKTGRLEELGKVEVVYDAEGRKANEARQVIFKQVEELDGKAAKAAKAKDPKADPKPADTPPDPAAQAQKEKLTKQAEAIKADHTESSGKLVAFYKKYDAQPEGWLAGMQAARILMDQDKMAEARPLLEEVVAKSKDSPFYQTQGRLTLAGLYEEAADYDKGLAEIDALEKIVDADMKPRVLLARGRMQMLKNAKAEAKATFNSIIENHSASPEAQKARSLIALLNG